ncbi:hypothetical protein RJP21_17700 [Paenibacillus sp. VCA1]|uniref:hypothetical protein n=1 Tax=Paenibacillus sp. VCA1 TaxID=3039148 RepID=UPI0028719B14|nr:hypothetical protein [Paenibacillus sp. VCA1]MDR9855453.1 hypothetical protein [Paenibacillus sp. VCA1]
MLQTLPERLLMAMLRRFLRNSTAAQLDCPSPAATAELERMAEQMRVYSKGGRWIVGDMISVGIAGKGELITAYA